MLALNNVTTKDAYDATTTLEGGEMVRATIEVFGNNSIFYSVKARDRSWGPDVHMAPGRAVRDFACMGLRVKSFSPGLSAQVTATLLEAYEVGA